MTTTAETPATTSLFTLIKSAIELGRQHRDAGLIPFGALLGDDVAELFRSSLFLGPDRQEWKTAFDAYRTVLMGDWPMSADERAESDYWYREEMAL